MVYEILPFRHSDDFGYEVTNKTKTSISAAQYSALLYQQIVEAQSRGEPSFTELPPELLISILVLAAFSSRRTGRALALASSWTSEMTRAARLKNVAVRNLRQLQSFSNLVRSSPHAAASVHTLWISTNAGYDAETSMVPGIVAVCSNLTAVACTVVPLEVSGDLRPSFRQTTRPLRFTLVDNRGWTTRIWSRLLQKHLAPGFLRDLTHLHSEHYQYNFATQFPAAHLAIGQPLLQEQPFFSLSDDSGEIRRFAHILRQLFVPPDHGCSRPPRPRMPIGPQLAPPPPHARELVRTARECSTYSNIMFYCASLSHRELKFWEACTSAGDDIWTLAEKQMALSS
ncbi:hypothetical protein B0H14DRAFT_3731941 [Mycena olivaceomarginata]|nr:hypothetical protein B0H14DRAFT_3731941 [Mycena olivaceomarginata]